MSDDMDSSVFLKVLLNILRVMKKSQRLTVNKDKNLNFFLIRQLKQYFIKPTHSII